MTTKRVIYQEPQHIFFNDVLTNVFIDKMSETAREFNIHPRTSELISWGNNAPKIKDLLELSKIKDTYVTFEYLVPYNMKRIDCILYGRDLTGQGSVVHVELKQWDNKGVQPTDCKGNFEVEEDSETIYEVHAYTGGKLRLVSHPSQQVKGYNDYLTGFVDVLSRKELNLEGLAYCYNYRKNAKPNALYDEQYNNIQKTHRTYSGDEVQDLAKRLHEILGNGDGLTIFNKMITSSIRPSKKLLESAATLVHEGNASEFALIEEQIVARNVILDKIQKIGKQKSVIVVKGGPGTGKTVIALHILSLLAGDGKNYNIHYATKSKPLLEGIKNRLPRGSKAKLLFSNVTKFIPANYEPNDLDVLLIDEAHRIAKSANTQYTPADKRTELSQIQTIIRSAKICVFFIDDKQAIRSIEIGSSSLIRTCAKEFNADIIEVELKSQFRCNGSNNYLDWLEQMLYNEPVKSSFKKEEFDFRIFDNPKTLYKEIVKKNNIDGQTARLTAGFCWPWSKSLDKNGDLVKDVVIGDFAMPWETNDSIETIPEGYVKWYEWAYKHNGINQVGCIYTAQGFEFDYIGVIIGPDLRYDLEKKCLITDIKEIRDPMLKRGIENFDTYVRNIYRVLMSRGMKGCYVYCCDTALAEYMRAQLAAVAEDDAATPVSSVRIEPEVNDEVKYIDFLPLYSIRAACGYFGEGEVVEPSGWIKADGIGKINRNMFVVRAVGSSMSPVIEDGDFCVFRAIPAGSRQGKTVLIQHYNHFDPDYSGSYSIKVYESIKAYNEDGTWAHERIMLNPRNKDYEPIVINEEDAEEYRIIGEFVGIIK